MCLEIASSAASPSPRNDDLISKSEPIYVVVAGGVTFFTLPPLNFSAKSFWLKIYPERSAFFRFAARDAVVEKNRCPYFNAILTSLF